MTVKAWALLAAALSPCSNLTGQATDLVGVVRDETSQAPLRGAVVLLLGPARDTVARALTSSTGAFRLRLETGRLVRVIRIGYLPYEAAIPSESSSPLLIALSPLGTRLRPVTIRASSMCPRRQDQHEALALWESATDGLSALDLSSRTVPSSGTVTQILFHRVIDDRDRVVRQSVRRVETNNVAPIRAARTPSELSRSGYVEYREDSTSYYAPDPQTLLDASFAETHCLSVRRDNRRPSRIGIAFAPVRRQDSIPDIAGVLWLNRQPMSLSTLEFEYRGVNGAIRDARAGGLIEFQTLTNGAPIIGYWHIRSPRLLLRPTGRYERGRVEVTGTQPVVADLHQTGGLLAQGALVDSTVWTAQLASISGVVNYLLTGDGVPGAVVTLDSTDFVAVTDSQGTFRIPGLINGPYTLRVVDSATTPRLHSDSIYKLSEDASLRQTLKRSAVIRFSVMGTEQKHVMVDMPWRAPLAECGTPSDGVRRFTVIGEVIRPDSMPLPSARLTLDWRDDGARDQERRTTIETGTDDAGMFVVCGAPADVPIDVIVLFGAEKFEGTVKVAEQVDKVPGRSTPLHIRAVTIIVAPRR